MPTAKALALFAVALSFAASAADPAPDAKTLIEAARAAMGGAALDAIVTWNEKGTVSAGGLDGTYDATVDLPSLANASHYVLGPTSGGSGWDGHDAWTTDTSGEPRVENSGEAVAQAKQDAYRSAFGFLFADRFEETTEYAGEAQADGRNYQKIKVKPAGAEPFEVWFDAATHRPAREVQLTGGLPVTYLLEDYRQFGGIWAPAKTIARVNGDAKYDTVTAITSLVFSSAEAAGRYGPPAPPQNTAQWPQGATSVTVPFRLINNHIYVEASINGSAPLTFVFDTGATDIIQVGDAKRLGIPVEGKLPGGGFGSNLEDFGFAKVKSVSLGGLVLPDQVFGTENSPGWMAVEGADSAGLLGYEFVKRAVLAIDYEKKTLTFTRSGQFQPPAGVEAIPFTFDGHVPMIAAKLDGVPGEFQVDTGSRAALILMKPFADANGLVAKYHATHLVTIGHGVGGPSLGLVTRAGQLAIGSVTVDAPVAQIMTEGKGVGGMTHVAGNIGGDLLKRFTVTLDYAHQKLWLQPNAAAGKPEVFDRSGTWIARAKDGGIELADVAAGSPAAKAGLATGDVIESVDGASAKQVQLYELRERFKGDVGTSFVLGVKAKKGRSRNVTLVLEEQV